VDEVLAVGDSSFQKKCLGKMDEVAKQGRTVLFVSHNLSAVSSLCQRALWIDEGRVRLDGGSARVVTDYLSQGYGEGSESSMIPASAHAHQPLGICFERVEILAAAGEPVSQLFFGSPVRVRARLKVDREFEAVRLAIAILRLDGTLVTTLHHTDDRRHDLLRVTPGAWSVDVRCPIQLMPGAYTLGLLVKHDPGFWGSGEPSIDFVEHAYVFHVGQIAEDGTAPQPSGAVLSAPSEWVIEQTSR
jgi:lipopolysaccharide transport system ATP-binding protein